MHRRTTKALACFILLLTSNVGSAKRTFDIPRINTQPKLNLINRVCVVAPDTKTIALQENIVTTAHYSVLHFVGFIWHAISHCFYAFRYHFCKFTKVRKALVVRSKQMSPFAANSLSFVSNVKTTSKVLFSSGF